MNSYDKIKSAYIEEITDSYRKKLTVSSLCEKAAVSRKSFYSNFSDLDDVFGHIVEDELIKPTRDLGRMLRECKSAPLIVCEHIFQLIYERREFFCNAYYALGDEKFRAALMQKMRIINDSTLRLAENIDKAEQGYIAEFFASCYASAVIIWIENKMNFPPQRLAEAYEKWVNLDWRKFGVQIKIS